MERDGSRPYSMQKYATFGLLFVFMAIT